MGRRKIDLTGQIFTRFTVATAEGKSKGGHILWRCHCECGNECVVLGNSLRRGHTKSCGCYRAEQLLTHGLSNHPLYDVWCHMLSRCRNVDHRQYQDYGGRGIKVCVEWLESFKTFYDDMITGYVKGLEIDRIDVNGGYSPDNCRWVTPQQNILNTRSRKGSTSQYKGVRLNKVLNKWVAQIKLNGVSTYLGLFTDEVEAAKAYNTAAIELFGEFAHLNQFSTP